MMRPSRVWKDIYIVGSAEISHPYDCCIYLIDTGDELVLIDSGAGRSFERIVNNIRFLGFEPENIKKVIATHAHIDHIGSLAAFQQHYGSAIMAHELDVEAIESGEKTGADFYGVDYQPCKVDVVITDSEPVIETGNYSLTTVHIPGHTPGSIVVFVDMFEKRVLFGQDIHGPYEPALGGNPDEAIDSLRQLIDLNADILCEGHFGIIHPANEVKKYIEFYRNELVEMQKG
jgi:glyoxylase-like metal-dependent hydrolase (beta-lactamase superfamily II)